MALVSRTAILGRVAPVAQSIETAMQAAVSELAVSAAGTQSGEVAGSVMAEAVTVQRGPHGTAGQHLDDPAAGTTVTATTVAAATTTAHTTVGDTPGPTNGEASAVPTLTASGTVIVIAFGIAALGGYVAYVMPQAHPFRISSAMAAYGALLVFAASVERLLEPFSHWLPGRHATNRYEHELADLMNGKPTATVTTVAHAKARADRAVADRAILSWSLATAFATIVSALSGFFLLRMIAAPDWLPTIPTWVDAIVTGVVVGSGTKPLHDLISRAQTPKDSAP